MEAWDIKGNYGGVEDGRWLGWLGLVDSGGGLEVGEVSGHWWMSSSATGALYGLS